MNANEQFLQINGLRYRVRVAGTGPPLVMLHGFTGASDNWTHANAKTLADDRMLIMPDLIGHGGTDAPADPARYAMDRAAADLIDLTTALGADQFDLLGYSMGGRLALYTALHHPGRVSRLILESASPGLATPNERATRRERDDQLANRIETEGIPAFVAYWASIPLFATQQALPQNVRDRLQQQRLQNRATGLAASLRGMGTGVQPSLWGRLDELQPPTLLITGETDPKFMMINRKMATTLPDVNHSVIPQAGHTTHLERPHVFQDLVRGHLQA